MILPLLSAQPPIVTVEEVSNYEMSKSISDSYLLAPPYFRNLRKLELERIASLGENWDGEGAKPISDNVVANAMTVIENMQETLLEGCHVYPIAYGNICLDFGNDDNLVSLECGKSKIGLFTDFSDGGNVVIDDIPCELGSIPDVVYEQLVRLYPQN